MRSLCAWTGMKLLSGNLQKIIKQILAGATENSLRKAQTGHDIYNYFN